ncbi:hypothetical protein M218_05760 [Burkholderia pseudomallei MSHR338]|nr:hypothetical protein M218_05760 [Burkholderia pseudomallei MSHR338]
MRGPKRHGAKHRDGGEALRRSVAVNHCSEA